MIAPPYFPLDDDELTRHFVSAANAADPLPFYVYEFVGRSGYAIPLAVVTRVRESAPNVVGMKVSDSPFSAVEPYLGLGLDVFIGSEPLALQGMGAGAVGSVSGLAAAFPELTASLVHQRSEAAHTQVCRLRDELAGIPFHAALKQVLVARDVLISPDVRAPRAGSPTPRGCGAVALPGTVGLELARLLRRRDAPELRVSQHERERAVGLDHPIADPGEIGDPAPAPTTRLPRA